MTKIGLVTGSFDPVTNGHLDIIARASRLFDTLYVGIFYNKNKKGLFSIAERKAMLEEAVQAFPNVKVVTAQDSLAVDVARELKAGYLVRGIRDAKDLEYEADLAFYNQHLASDIESVFLLTSPEWLHVSSSRIRELMHFHSDISAFVPESVVKKVEEKYDNLKRI
ncbi:pantetheine-phosphate adenylyltransferase [Streptococcus sp. TATVAM-FAB35]|uniref:pantetheine-phosphate adenylyltransferase n=1 Tax=Streptococcus TaxID=1301 RepID=UPI003980D885